MYIKFFDELTNKDVPLVGGKNASLGEMYVQLKKKGVPVPNGFAITVDAYKAMLNQNDGELKKQLHEQLDSLDVNNLDQLNQAARKCRDAVYAAPLPAGLMQEISKAAAKIREADPLMTFAVRSSATAEDLPTASFAGQHDSYLHIDSNAALMDATKRCLASLFSARAIHYRVDQKFDHFSVYLSVGVQRMVRSDLASAGVAFSIDTESGHPDFILITGNWGLGETVVQGAADVDEWLLHKPTQLRGPVRRRIGSKKIKMVYASERSAASTRTIATSDAERRSQCLSDEEVGRIARFVLEIEKHYGCPMDVEWAKDGSTNELLIVQARPETVVSQRQIHHFSTFVVDEEARKRSRTLATGRAVGEKVAAGRVRFVKDTSELKKVQRGDVLAADITSPDWEPIMQLASALICARGGRTCHAAIVARELGIPAVVGVGGSAIEALGPDGSLVTVDCSQGDEGVVLQGSVPFTEKREDLTELFEQASNRRTLIKANVGNPGSALTVSRLPLDGVGLARLEFIVSAQCQFHPMAALHMDRVISEEDRQKIRDISRNDASPADAFCRLLAEGVSTICAAFYPRPVIVRLSDFKTNEYASLIGGAAFEPHEENPMIGHRGASRYADDSYREGFALECRAMRHVKEDLGLDNIKLMVPFCRTLTEARNVLDELNHNGAGQNQGFEVYCMVEIPANVILIDKFAELYDGFSIGSNDLTQLTLGIDRDSSTVSGFDERNEAVMELIRQAVAGAKKAGKEIGLCGQGASDHPDFAEFLVSLGIDSLSVTSDRVIQTIKLVQEIEENGLNASGATKKRKSDKSNPPSKKKK